VTSKAHKGDPIYTVHLREVDADYDQDPGWEVVVTKEGFPPHATEFFTNRAAAQARYDELT